AEGDQPAAEETPSREEASGDADAERTEKTPTAADDREQPLFRSPLARKLARDNDIDLAAVTGTGPGGRIVRADVQEAIETGAARRRPAEPEPSAIEGTAPTAGLPEPAKAGEDDDEVRINANQRITGQRLTQMTGVPTFELSATVEVDELLVRASAVALSDHPEVNSAWGGDKVIRRGHVNIGLAIALEAGLIVPVIRDADRKSVGQIAREARDLADRARDGTLETHEYQG